MWTRISGLLLRHLYLYRRSLPRAMEIFFWPVMDLLVWGFLMSYLQTLTAPGVVLYLLGAMILWDVLYRSQQALTLSLTEEIWVKNIINLFIAPLSVFEFGLALCLMGLLKALITVAVLGTLAWAWYGFSLAGVGAGLIPYLGCLLLFGWALGLFTTALILRFGHAAEALVWGVPFLLQPFSAVFYPLAVLPGWLHPVALCLPSTHVFEGMRATLAGAPFSWSGFAALLALNLLWLAVGAVFFGWMFRQARNKGYLGRLGME